MIRIGLPRWYSGEHSACQCRRCGFDPGLGRFPGVGNGNLFQYTCLEDRMDEEPGRLQSVGLHRVRHDWPHARVIRIYVLFCIPVNSMWSFSLPYPCKGLYLSIFLILAPKWFIVILICVSVMTSGVDHLFTGLLSTHIFFGELSIQIFCLFFNCVVCLFIILL